MTAQGFQIEVTTRGQPGVRVFAIAASSQAHAEILLQRGGHMTGGATAELKRQLSADDVAKYGLAPGSIVKIR